MRPDQKARMDDLRDRLIERALIDADPENWVAGNKYPEEMTREERGDAKWCRSLALSTVSLAMQVQRMMSTGATGPVGPGAEPDPMSGQDAVEAEVARFEAAAAELLASRAVNNARNARPKR